MLGHTDKATINKRRPLTENMKRVLSELADKGLWRHDLMSQSDQNAIRALCDRGYADWHIENRSHSITPQGRDALSEKFVVVGDHDPEPVQ